MESEPLTNLFVRFGLLQFRSPLLSQSLFYFLFLQVLRCFSSLGSPHTSILFECMITLYYQCCVSTFGYLRISVYVQLPVAFRSLSRPSSAPSAKASTLRSSSLNRIVLVFVFISIRTWKICFWFFPQQNIIFVNFVYYSLIFLFDLFCLRLFLTWKNYMQLSMYKVLPI